MIRMEEGVPEKYCTRICFFQYFLGVNFLIFLTFCCCSLWSLYQLGKVMKVKEPIVVVRYEDPTTTTPEPPDDSLNQLLGMITDTMKEFAAERKGQLVTNLTDHELKVLKEHTTRLQEYAKMKRSKRSELGCDDLNFTIDTGDNERIRVVVKPVKYGQGRVNVKSVVTYPRKNDSSVRECAFDVSYEPKGQA